MKPEPALFIQGCQDVNPMLFAFLLISTVLLAIGTFLPLWRHEAWWVRSLDFPRLQLAWMALTLVVIELGRLDRYSAATWGLLLATLLCLGYQLWWILPYTWLFPAEVVAAESMDERYRIRIMAANVLTPNRNANAFINLVRRNRPDILMTSESDEWWQSRLDSLESEYPYTVKCPLDNLYGMHVYSKLPILESRIEYLVESDVPSIHALTELPAGEKVRMHFLHPAPPSPTENEASAERDAELIVVAKSVAETSTPVIVAGDLNDVAWSATTRLFRKISGLLDPRLGRGMFNTFHTGYWFVRWPLDHLFHSRHFKLSGMRRLEPFGSDHFAIFTELILEPGAEDPSVKLNADTEDKHRADAKIAQQNVDPNDVPEPDKSAASSAADK